MVVYGAGFATIFLLFAAMYWRAGAAGDRSGEPARGAGASSAIRSSTSASPRCRWGWRCSAAAYASAYSGVAYGLIGPCQGLYHGLTALLEAAGSGGRDPRRPMTRRPALS